jgi:hypothetical protein
MIDQFAGTNPDLSEGAPRSTPQPKLSPSFLAEHKILGRQSGTLPPLFEVVQWHITSAPATNSLAEFWSGGTHRHFGKAGGTGW